MQYFLTSDWHVGFKKNSPIWLDYFLNTLDNFLIPHIEENKKSEKDKLIILGDVFHERYSIGNRIISPILEGFKRLSQHIEIHILSGNHDLFSNSSSKYCSLDILGEFATIYKEPFLLDENVLILPFRTVDNKESSDEVIRRFKKEYPNLNLVLSHSFFEGFSTFSNNETISDVDLLNKISCFVDFPDIQFVSGHIHKIQKKDNILHIGSLLSNTFSDVGEKKGLFLYDCFSKSVKFKENTISPNFKDLDIKDFLFYDIDEFKKDYNNSFVRLIFKNAQRNKLNTELLREMFNGSVLDFTFKREYSNDIKMLENSEQEKIDVTFLFNKDEIWKIVERFVDNDESIKKKLDEYLSRLEIKKEGI